MDLFKKKIIAVLTLALLCGLVQVSYAQKPDTIYIGGNNPGHYAATAKGIEQAFNDVKELGVIKIDQNITLDRSIYLNGTIKNKSIAIDGSDGKGSNYEITAGFETTLDDLKSDPNPENHAVINKANRALFTIFNNANVKIRNLVLDCQNSSETGTIYGIYYYETGTVELDRVTIKNAKRFPGTINKFEDRQGGFAIESNTAKLELGEKIKLIDCEEGGIFLRINENNNSLTSSLSLNARNISYSRTVKYLNETNSSSNYLDSINKKHALIRAENKTGITLYERTTNGTNDVAISSFSNNDNEDGFDVHPKQIDENWNSYLPKTLQTHYFRAVDNGKTLLPNGQYNHTIALLPKVTKIKALAPFKIENEVKYKWTLEKSGKMYSGDIPEYKVTAIPQGSETSSKLVGEVKVVSLGYEKPEAINIYASSSENPLLTNAKDSQRVTDWSKPIKIEIELPNNIDQETLNKIKNGTVDITLNGDSNKNYYLVGDRTISIPINSTPINNEVDKSIEIKDSKYTFNPPFIATADGGNKPIQRTYKLGKITSEIRNTASSVLASGKKIKSNEVILNPLPKVNIKFDAGKGGKLKGSSVIPVNTVYKLKDQNLTLPTVIPPEHYEFVGWSPVYDENATITKTPDKPYVAQYELKKVNVTFIIGKGKTSNKTNYSVTTDKTLEEQGVKIPRIKPYSGYSFVGWLPNPELGKKVSTDTEFVAQYVKKAPTGGGSSGGGTTIIVVDKNPKDEEIEINTPLGELEDDDHFAYIQGYPDGTVRPNGLLTREEVATIFFRLLEDKYRERIRSNINTFNDIKATRWSNKYISTLQNGKILNGYPDGGFKPKKYITRAEVAKLSSKFDVISSGKNHDFIDINAHWAEDFISSAYNKGWLDWVNGTKFQPNKYITRAEFITFVNNILDRHVEVNDILPNIIQFKDLQDKDVWYYCPMVVATNSYEYEKDVNDDSTDDVTIQDKNITPLGSGKRYQKWTKLIYPDIEM